MRKIIMLLIWCAIFLVPGVASADADIVNQGQSWILSLSFFDETKAPATPTSATYRVDNVDDGTPLLADSAISISGSTATILIAPAQTAILQARPVETRRVVVTWQYGGNKQGVSAYYYQVRNLTGTFWR